MLCIKLSSIMRLIRRHVKRILVCLYSYNYVMTLPSAAKCQRKATRVTFNKHVSIEEKGMGRDRNGVDLHIKCTAY